MTSGPRRVATRQGGGQGSTDLKEARRPEAALERLGKTPGAARPKADDRQAVVVIVLTACPVGLRGHLTRWLLEISAGVFVGKVSARVRDELWQQVLGTVKDGRALMVHDEANEQGYSFRSHRHNWDVVDVDGLTLMRRPERPENEQSVLRKGWSTASKQRRAGRLK